MKKIVKFLVRLLVEIVVITCVLMGIRIFTDGMYLFGLPDLKNVESVTISYPSVAEENKTVTTQEDMEMTLKLTGFLKYDLLGKADTGGEPLITMTYHLKDGTEKVISANRTVLWWNEKVYPIKNKDMFINLTEGIFFLEDVAEDG